MLAFLVKFIHLVVCLALIVIVLFQADKGEGLAGAFGGGASATLFGERGAETQMSKMTTYLAVIFMITSLIIAVWGPGWEKEAQNAQYSHSFSGNVNQTSTPAPSANQNSNPMGGFPVNPTGLPFGNTGVSTPVSAPVSTPVTTENAAQVETREAAPVPPVAPVAPITTAPVPEPISPAAEAPQNKPVIEVPVQQNETPKTQIPATTNGIPGVNEQ